MILQDAIPYDVLSPRPLPGVAPFAMPDWLHVDSAYAAQMAERGRLLDSARAEVLWMDPGALPAAQELLEMVLAHLPEGFAQAGACVTCPDGRVVRLDRQDPLQTLGRLVQEDLCLLVREGDEHVLKGAVLCFPASWTLAEKAGKPLVRIHAPVAEYDPDIARRVQRLFDGVQPGRPLWRFNALWYVDPALHQPRGEHAPRRPTAPAAARFLRSERQCLVRLPQSGAVVFSIHTYVVTSDALPGAAGSVLDRA